MLKRKFRIALASAGLRQCDWARAHHISQPTLTTLLNDKIRSRRLTKLINDFIDTEFRKINQPIKKAA